MAIMNTRRSEGGKKGLLTDAAVHTTVQTNSSTLTNVASVTVKGRDEIDVSTAGVRRHC